MKKSSTTGSGGSHFQSEGGVYKVIKLKTNELILTELASELSDFSFMPTIELINPMSIVQISKAVKDGKVQEEEMALKPFLSLTNSTRFPLSTDTIITMGNMKPATVTFYKAYAEGVQRIYEEEARDEAIFDLLRSIAPDRPLLFIHHETPMVTEIQPLDGDK